MHRGCGPADLAGLDDSVGGFCRLLVTARMLASVRKTTNLGVRLVGVMEGNAVLWEERLLNPENID
jgi:hypothetical protein